MSKEQITNQVNKAKRKSSAELFEAGGTLLANVRYPDPDTGEIIIQGANVRMTYTEKHYQRVRMIEHCDRMVSMEPSCLNMVLCYIFSNMKTADNVVIGSQTYIAKQLGFKPLAVKKVFKKLKETGYINYPAGVQGYFRVNPHIIMQGSDKLEKMLFESWDKELDDKTLLELSKLRPVKTPALKKAIEERKAGGKNEG